MSKERSRWTTTADARPVMIVLALALLVGFIASRFVNPVYVARATLWVQKGNSAEQIRTERVVLSAVSRNALFLETAPDADPALFAGIGLKERFLPGLYTLTVDSASRRWVLEVYEQKIADSGAAGDSIGRMMGFSWAPPAGVVARHAGRQHEFTVNTPRDAAADLRLKLTAVQPVRSRFLSLTLADKDPRRAARALNAIATRYAELANARGVGPVTVLDSAVAPRSPARNSAGTIMGQAVLAGTAIGLCLILVQAVRSTGPAENRSALVP